MSLNLKKKLASEFLGTLFLLTIVVGSGIMGERLSSGNSAIALLANSLATGGGLLILIWIFGEFVATYGLIMVIRGPSQNHNEKIPFAVAAYITAAYWFTSSSSFAKPAVTIARSLTPTFSGIDPKNILGFILAQIAGAFGAEISVRWLFKDSK